MDAPPPPYEANPSSGPSTKPPPSANEPTVPHKTRNGIPPHSRRSMEDENRELPDGWVRQYDSKSHHQFFVDTRANPPRSTWHHPYDDSQYMNSLSSDERSRIQGLHRQPSEADIIAEDSDVEHDDHELPPRPEPPVGGVHKFGRKMKDKLTQTTHEQREQERQQRAVEEQRTYERHQFYRAQMSKAAETGEPQLLGKDKDGKDVYIEPPYGDDGGYPGRYSQGAYGYNPYSQGPYSHPNARYIRPQDPYSRPYGYGYGGGMGMPLMGMGMMGLGGGMMLGGPLGMGGFW